jgi:hypothetical protein
LEPPRGAAAHGRGGPQPRPHAKDVERPKILRGSTPWRRYGCRAYGPGAFDPDEGPPEAELQTIVPKSELPGGLLAFRDPRGWTETPVWLPQQGCLVFADALTERAGVLRVWMSPTHEERALPDLRAMLDLPIERVPRRTRPYARCVQARWSSRSGRLALCTRPPTMVTSTRSGASWRRELT